ncbi:hypothetical protein R1sor_018664 [Riccia sorocarpa]|uniref:Uncharacterized protein n=1 Tax=Riccia sorocarpa TaxID=122646 RepID=A0ABD3ID18_9MARC
MIDEVADSGRTQPSQTGGTVGGVGGNRGRGASEAETGTGRNKQTCRLGSRRDTQLWCQPRSMSADYLAVMLFLWRIVSWLNPCLWECYDLMGFYDYSRAFPTRVLVAVQSTSAFPWVQQETDGSSSCTLLPGFIGLVAVNRGERSSVKSQVGQAITLPRNLFDREEVKFTGCCHFGVEDSEFCMAVFFHRVDASILAWRI